MSFGLSQNWDIKSAGGSTGNAFLAWDEDTHEKIFLKRNTSPFLAALSAEEITPKLLWTKRLANGDILTAQRWIDGVTLKSAQMQDPRVAKLLAKVHSSDLLKRMLEKIGGSFITPDQMLANLKTQLPHSFRHKKMVRQGLNFLSDHTLQVPISNYRVCHGDLNKKNWLIFHHQLYLVDWDQAILSDPVYDLTTILIHYIPFSQWPTWLNIYGLNYDFNIVQRVQWYAVLQAIQDYYDNQQKNSSSLEQVLAHMKS